MQTIDIPQLDDSLDEINFIKGLVSTATAATSVKQGDTQKTDVTLGEVQLATQAANERITSISKFYMLAQKEFGWKWAQIVNANADKLEEVKLYKKSHKGNYFKKTITGKDWKSDEGYNCRVISTSEREQNDVKSVQKLQAVASQFPGNAVMQKIYQEKLLDFGDLTPDQKQEVLAAEKQTQEAQAQAAQQQPGQPQPGQPGQPAPTPQPALAQPAPQLTPS
jgi:hypothetical protein